MSRVPIARIAAGAGLVIALAGLGAPASGADARRAVLDLGDSLSVGTAPFLKRELPGYRIGGYRAVGLRSQEVARRIARSRALPHVLVVSAGTNDDPHEVSAFSQSVSGVLEAAGRARCVVWSNIVRPPVGGRTYSGFNRTLADAARHSGSLVLVDWVGMLRRHPGWLGRDGVHASEAGYRARARAIANAVKSRCAT